jgi:hypothetical protein
MTTDRDTRSPWTAQDEAFFRIVQSAFSPAFLAAATALLAGYDDTSGDAQDQLVPAARGTAAPGLAPV